VLDRAVKILCVSRKGDAALLDRIEGYFDAVPRSATRAEAVGPFTLFVQDRAWPYYARPAVAGAPPSRVDQVTKVLTRQRELGLPQAIEWVHDTCPALASLAREAGLSVHELPLMVLRDPPAQSVLKHTHAVRLLGPADPTLAAAIAVAQIGFASEGTAVGTAGAAERDAAAARVSDSHLAFATERLRAGHTVMAVAEHGFGPVGVGSHRPVGDLTEVVGVATLPAFRRRGIGAAVTAALVADAFQHGVDLILLSAGSDEIARVYANVGFARVATFCAAEITGGTEP
jgi:ribosomal protein S18 acetylase RimI-like enzyme